MKVAVTCFLGGWFVYLIVILAAYHAFMHRFTIHAASGIERDADALAIARSALALAGEDPEGFRLKGESGGSAVARISPNSAEVEFRGKGGDLREMRVILKQKGEEVECTVAPD